MNLSKAFEVLSVLGTAGEALEADEAAQAGNRKLESVVVGTHRLGYDRLEIEGGHAATHEIDDTGCGDRTQVTFPKQVLIPYRLPVALANRVEPSQRREHAPVVVDFVGDEEVDVLGGADKSIRDHRESTDDHKAGTRPNHRPRGYVELRIE